MELVRRLQPPPNLDLAAFLRDEAAAAVEAASGDFTDDFVATTHQVSSESYSGLEGLRQAWLDWLEPWESYRVEIERVIDLGDRVLVLVHDYGRLRGAEEEVRIVGAALWTIRDDKISRAEFFADRNNALEAAGLS